MSALSERGEVARLGIEQGILAIANGMDNDKASLRFVQTAASLASVARAVYAGPEAEPKGANRVLPY
jgi:hypothetical protein